MKRKIILTCFLLLVLAIFPAGTKIEDRPIPLIPETNPKAESGFVYVQGSHFYLDGEVYQFKGVNYYPSKNSWRRMWENWDAAEINTELALLENIGVNTIRVFLDYKLFERHRIYGEFNIMLIRLDELLAICELRGMRALVTPFVWGSGNIATDRAHIRAIVTRFKDDKRIFGWDISNELDHAWIGSPALKPAIQAWAKAIFEEVKSIDSNHLSTIGDYGWYLGDRSDPYGSGILLDLSQMSIPLADQDFICFHWYSHAFALDVALAKLKQETGKPIVIEEIGLPTNGIQGGVPWYLSEQDVANYFFSWMNVTAQRGAYAMPWCGFDYVPYLSPYPPDSTENFWGLYTTDYRLKAAGEIFRDFKIEGRKIMEMLNLPTLKKFERREIYVER